MFVNPLKSSLVGLLLLFLTACQATTPIPTASPPAIMLWQVQFTPALRWLSPLMTQCTREQPSTSLVIFERPAPSFERSGANFSLRWSAPDRIEGFAAVLGYDELVIITHPANPLHRMTLADIKAIFSGKIQKWQEIPGAGTFTGEIITWIFPEGDDIAQVMARAFDIQRSLPGAFLAPDPETLLLAIASDPHAIGYLPKRWLNASVQVVELSGISTDLLRQPLLAVTPQEPVGAQKQWLVCLQQQVGTLQLSTP